MNSGIALLLLVALVVYGAVSEARRRGRMTPAERTAEDEEVRKEMLIW